MSELQTIIANNLAAIVSRVEAAAVRTGRSSESVRILPVTKAVGPEAVLVLRGLGLNEFGENRVDHAREQIAAVGEGARWRMIGNVQRRKAGEIAALFDAVDAVDRLKLAETLQRRCEEQDTGLVVLIEVNVSGEASKHGFAPEALPEVFREIRHYERLKPEGLLTMAPYGAPPENIRAVFRRLRELAVEHGLPEVSMGMSDDFEIAVEEGATQIRIGRALFE